VSEYSSARVGVRASVYKRYVHAQVITYVGKTVARQEEARSDAETDEQTACGLLCFGGDRYCSKQA
jgi:hypothetical protein